MHGDVIAAACRDKESRTVHLKVPRDFCCNCKGMSRRKAKRPRSMSALASPIARAMRISGNTGE